MATKVKKDTKRGVYMNTLRKWIVRETRGGHPSQRLPLSTLMIKNYPHRYCIPLSDIQKDNAFRAGHILLGFTASGEYLMSYRVRIMEDTVNGIPNHKYTLHWWRFNLMQPLQEICHISLFAGELFMEELHLIVCHTRNANQIYINGYSRVGSDDQSRQCFMTISPSPPCRKCFSSRSMSDHAFVCKDSSAIHLKYNLLPPFPVFIPSVQLKLRDTIVINTVDSLIALSVNQSINHENDLKSEGVTNVELIDKECQEESMSEDVTNVELHKECQGALISEDVTNVELHKECQGALISEDVTNVELIDIKCEGVSEDMANVCTESIDKKEEEPSFLMNYKLINNVELSEQTHLKFCHLSTFNLQTFCLTDQDDTDQNFDHISHVDIQVTNVNNSSYKLIGSLQSNSSIIDNEVARHKAPCVHTHIVSLDVERYINEALNLADELSEKYWILRNYSTQFVDVCERSRCIVVQVTCLLSVQPKFSMLTRERRGSLSCIFSWNISNGEVSTLDVSKLIDPMKKTDKQVFEESSKKVFQFRRKHFIPSGLVGIQAFSNHTVFTGSSLNIIKHPFQPVAVVLYN